MTLNRAEAIQRMEKNGQLVRDCPGCQVIYNSKLHPFYITNPPHKAKETCESGGHNHCTCDKCF